LTAIAVVVVVALVVVVRELEEIALEEVALGVEACVRIRWLEPDPLFEITTAIPTITAATANAAPRVTAFRFTCGEQDAASSAARPVDGVRGRQRCPAIA
jgi:hypothetical protein